MLTLRKLIVPLAGLVLLVGFGPTSVRADDAAPPAGKAKISVTVVDKNGAAVADAQVGLFNAPKHDKAATGGKVKPTPIAEMTTDKDGKATFPNIADGAYGVMARVKSVGNGRARVSVTDGADAEVTLTLTPRKGAPAGPTDGANHPAAPAEPAAPAAPASPK
jgi:hypothetical protein